MMCNQGPSQSPHIIRQLVHWRTSSWSIMLLIWV